MSGRSRVQPSLGPHRIFYEIVLRSHIKYIIPSPFNDSTMVLVLAFDIGIKNLAFSIINRDTNDVVALENVNLMTPVDAIKCSYTLCKHPAKYSVNESSYCKRHVPKTHIILKELEQKKPLTRQQWKELAEKNQCVVHGSTIDAYHTALSSKVAFPVVQPKQGAVAKLSLEEIHDALRGFIKSRWDQFHTVQHILLENQPAFKNPHMKSVQVLLFASLREAFLRCDPIRPSLPSFHLVHAKKKVSDAKKGDAGYTERKQKSEERVKQLFESKEIHGQTFFNQWNASKKKSDMADAICMAMDFVLKK